MNAIPQCPDCACAMEKGFQPDNAYYRAVQSLWHPGEVEPETFFGLKVNQQNLKLDKSKIRPVIAYRCPQCGLLRSYAE
ncbi:PF20097 family protein [Gimesia fumaroli]|uniref:Uncharacterized protein n=1 Tax=Gimesia fumaroli TaxID=2527976 RepID=A0A518II65_9PLAN|nr:PF20097 family protein [Gimesia fumaroli]QDV52793.1 hypothetical protein Enr17x_48610 [Gimesia fumaroli]